MQAPQQHYQQPQPGYHQQHAQQGAYGYHHAPPAPPTLPIPGPAPAMPQQQGHTAAMQPGHMAPPAYAYPQQAYVAPPQQGHVMGAQPHMQQPYGGMAAPYMGAPPGGPMPGMMQDPGEHGGGWWCSVPAAVLPL